ncbi:MAG: hypothetical protein LBQ05_01315 [Christensenellaceae bacterium]|jgi:hypothetical protein|nr:hypothetical protein [Christensenellaceae bacterium]
MGKFNIVAFSKSKKYRIIMISLMSFGAILAGVGFIMYSSVSKQTPPRHLSLVTLSNAIPVQGRTSEYTVKLSQDEAIVISTGTTDMVLSSPIEFIRNDSRYPSCVDIIEPIAPMYREGPTMLRLKKDAINHSSGVLVIRCGGETEIILYIEAYFD